MGKRNVQMKKKLFSWCFIIVSLIIYLIYYLFFPQLFFPKLNGKINNKCIEGTFDLRVNLPLNRNILIRYLIPVDFMGKPLTSASNIVFYAPFNGEAHKIRKDLPSWIKEMAHKYGLTVFSMTIEADTSYVNEKKTYYIYKECGWYGLVFKIKKHLERQFNLRSRKLLLAGESSGGSMIQQMIVANPAEIAGAAWSGGSRYVDWKQNCKIPMLALNTWGCYGCAITSQLVSRAHDKKIPIQHLLMPSFRRKDGKFEHHAASPLSFSLMQKFLADIVYRTKQFQHELDEYPYDKFCRVGSPKIKNILFLKKNSKKNLIYLNGNEDNSFDYSVRIKELVYYAWQNEYSIDVISLFSAGITSPLMKQRQSIIICSDANELLIKKLLETDFTRIEKIIICLAEWNERVRDMIHEITTKNSQIKFLILTPKILVLKENQMSFPRNTAFRAIDYGEIRQDLANEIAPLSFSK